MHCNIYTFQRDTQSSSTDCLLMLISIKNNQCRYIVYLVGMYTYIAKNDTRTFQCQVSCILTGNPSRELLQMTCFTCNVLQNWIAYQNGFCYAVWTLCVFISADCRADWNHTSCIYPLECETMLLHFMEVPGSILDPEMTTLTVTFWLFSVFPSKWCFSF